MLLKHPVAIKYHANISQLEQVKGSDWIDLHAAESVELKAGEYRKISLGISMKLPRGYEALVAPRSSTYERYGIIQANSIAVFDNSYCGENDIWMFLAIAMRETYIPLNARICQFRIQRKQPTLLFFRGALSKRSRGGIGSTGDLYPIYGK